MVSLSPRQDLIQASQNLLLNSCMSLFQRNTTVSVASNASGYLADRFVLANNTANAITYSRSTDVPTFTQSGYQGLYSSLITIGTGAAAVAGTLLLFSQRVEGFNYSPIHGQKVRFQTWVKTSIAGTYAITFMNSAGTRSYTTNYAIASANVWTSVVVDLTMDAAGTWLFDSGLGLQVIWTLAAGTTFQTSSLNTWNSTQTYGSTGQTQLSATTGATFQITQCMLLQADLAGKDLLPFSRANKSIGAELAACQRYYEKSYDVDVVPGTVSPGTVINSHTSIVNGNGYIASIYFKVPKRTTPSFTAYNGATQNQVITYTSANVTTARTPTVESISTNTYAFSVPGTDVYMKYHFVADADF